MREAGEYGLQSRDSVTSSNLSCVHVKLTDAALKVIEDLQNGSVGLWAPVTERVTDYHPFLSSFIHHSFFTRLYKFKCVCGPGAGVKVCCFTYPHEWMNWKLEKRHTWYLTKYILSTFLPIFYVFMCALLCWFYGLDRCCFYKVFFTR